MNDLKEVIYGLEIQLMYYRKSDFEQLLSEGFFEFGTSGSRLTKAILLESITEEGLTEIPFAIQDFELHVIREDVIQTRYVTIHKDTNKSANRSSIWHFESNQWRMYFHQGTPANI